MSGKNLIRLQSVFSPCHHPDGTPEGWDSDLRGFKTNICSTRSVCNKISLLPVATGLLLQLYQFSFDIRVSKAFVLDISPVAISSHAAKAVIATTGATIIIPLRNAWRRKVV